MKIIIIFCTFLTLNGFSQITIDQNDMQASGDTIYYGVSNAQGFDPAQTGTDYIWDFSNLSALTHRSDTILTVFQTPAVYNVVFNPIIANQAYINQTPPTFGNGLTVTEYYDFYKKSSSYYRKAGFGAMINSVPTPVKYDNPEIFYSFPLNYNYQDSSVSNFGLTVPSFGYFGQTINHKYIVDGWGTLTIPYGTFQALRVKTTINITDTIYYDALMYGIKINRPTNYEYYWIAKSLQGHALKITQAGIGYSAEFLDSLSYTTNVQTIGNNIDFKIFPNPANNEITIQTNFNNFPTNISIKDNLGRVVFEKELNNNVSNIDVSNIKSGYYFVEIKNKQSKIVRNISIVH